MQRKVSQNQFWGQSFYIGIDYHRKTWKVTILSRYQELKTMSQNPDPVVLSNYLNRNYPGGTYKAVYEAGFSGFTSCRHLRELGVDCMVIHPADVPTSQKERMQKTDKTDSRKLAKSLRSGLFTGLHIPERNLEADRALLRQRYRLVKEISRTKNRVKSLLFQFGIPIPDQFSAEQTRHWSKVYMNWLNGLQLTEAPLKMTLDNYIRLGEFLRSELLLINRQVKALAITESYEKNYRLLCSIPGIGPIAAMTLLVEIGDISRFQRLDELNSYIGLVPRMYASGDKTQTGKLTKRGRKQLKNILIEAAWVAVRYDPALTAKYNELLQKMTKNKAIIRIARKLLSRIRHVLKHQEEYVSGIVQ